MRSELDLRHDRLPRASRLRHLGRAALSEGSSGLASLKPLLQRQPHLDCTGRWFLVEGVRVSGPEDPCDPRAIVTPQKSVNHRQCPNEILSERTRKNRSLPWRVWRGVPDQHEGSQAVPHQLVGLAGCPANALVVAEDNPTVLASFGHPIKVIRALCEVVIVPLAAEIRCAKDAEEDVIVEVGVYEEDGVRRRALRR